MKKASPMIILQTLWGKRCPFKGEESKAARLAYLSELCGRRVESAKDLSAKELTYAIYALRKDQKLQDRNGKGSSAPPSSQQFFLIRQLEQSLGWTAVPERLSGFIRSKYRRDRPDQLTASEASKLIEALFRVWARNTIKQAKGPDYPVGNDELKECVINLKQNLNYAKEQRNG